MHRIGIARPAAFTRIGRRFAFGLLGGLLALSSSAWADEPAAKATIAAADARDHVGETCTVELTVRLSKNAAPPREYYLDSEKDFRDEKNLAVVISYDHADLFKKAGIDDPSAHYKGKTLRVTGKIIREKDQTRIRVEDPKQITLVDDKAK